MRKYVIVGSGAAGISAAETIRAHDPGGSIAIISEDPFFYYSRPGLAYLLSGEIPQKMLYPKQEEEYLQLNLRINLSRAVALDPAQHIVTLQNGERIPYDRLLIATGAGAFRPTLPGIDLEGVVKLDSLEDAQKILKLARRGKQAVVVGGGITSLELVEGLSSRGLRVSYLMRDERYWKNVLDETESKIIEGRLEEDKVHIHKNTEVEEILGRKGRVAGLRTKDGRRLPCDILAIAIGVKPRLELAKSANLNLDRGILVSETLQTSAEDVYAAGDAAQVYDPYTGRSVLDSLWGPARDQGRFAGMNMTGITTPYRKSLAFNVTRLANLTTTLIGTIGSGTDKDLAGIARGDSEVYRQLPDALIVQDSFDFNRIRIVMGESVLQGAVIIGDQTLSSPLQELVSNQVDITCIREELTRPKISLGETIFNLWSRWKRGPSC